MKDMAAQYLTSGSWYLRELDASGCVLLTDHALRHLEKICPPLCSITMACCNSISKLDTHLGKHCEVQVLRGNLWAEGVCSLRTGALKLQPRMKHWEHSNNDPPYWFGNGTGQMMDPITRPIRLMTPGKWWSGTQWWKGQGQRGHPSFFKHFFLRGFPTNYFELCLSLLSTCLDKHHIVSVPC